LPEQGAGPPELEVEARLRRKSLGSHDETEALEARDGVRKIYEALNLCACQDGSLRQGLRDDVPGVGAVAAQEDS
jgi:hypothetical protein